MVGEGSLPYDPRHWHNIQPPEFMDVSRRFEYDEDHLRLLKRWLRLDSEAPRTIVEVGCGSGFFTEKLVKMAPGSEIVGVEPDDVLRGHVGFVKGTAESIPLPSAFRAEAALRVRIGSPSLGTKTLSWGFIRSVPLLHSMGRPVRYWKFWQEP